MDQSDVDDYLINKETLYPGTKYIPFVDGTRVSALQVEFSGIFVLVCAAFHVVHVMCVHISDQISLSDTNMSRVW